MYFYELPDLGNFKCTHNMFWGETEPDDNDKYQTAFQIVC